SEGNWTAGQMNVLGVNPHEDEYLERLDLSYGRLFTSPDAREALLDQGAQRVLKVEIGETITLPGPGGPIELEVVGIVHKPEIIATLLQTVYVPLGTLQRNASPEAPDALTSITGEFVVGVDADAFVADWSERLGARSDGWGINLVREQREALDDGLRGMNLLSLMG